MTNVACMVDDDSMAPLFKKGDVVIVDVQTAVNARLTINRIIGKDVIFTPNHATLCTPITGKLISTHRHF